MSVDISQELCVGCGECAAICPGSLIALDGGVAAITWPERCWGCASCVKECPNQAIALFLGEDMGGLGGRMTVLGDGPLLHWTLKLPGGGTRRITTDSRDGNKY